MKGTLSGVSHRILYKSCFVHREIYMPEMQNEVEKANNGEYPKRRK